MKNKYCIFYLFLFHSVILLSQAPEINWENTIGGGSDDYGYVIRQTTDGGYFIAGTSNSNLSGDKTANNIGGTFDIWVLKLDASGIIEWQKTIGGTGDDGPFGYGGDAQQTIDGGYIVGISSKSGISGDKTEPCYGGLIFYGDYWIIKLDSLGNIEWQNTIGGYGDDRFVTIRQTADGGYLAGGYSNSSASYDKVENCLGGMDYWVVKLDELGNIIWQNTIGGGNEDFFSGLTLTNDGGSLITGTSVSDISGDKNENSVGGYDLWVVKLDSAGNIEWQNDIGGSGFENNGSVVQTNDGGFLIGGSSSSEISGDKTETIVGETGYSDFWIIKLSADGNIEWQNTIGTEEQDQLTAIHLAKDNGFIIGGMTTGGFSGDKTEPNYGGYDYWVLKLDSIGHIIWQNTIGGWGADYLMNIEVNADSSVALIGYSNSPASVDKSENYIDAGYGPKIDYWIVKLSRECHFTTYYKDSDADGFGWNDSTMSICNDIPPLGYVANNIDCNDLIDYGETIYPGATELCNLIDDNCNGLIDDGLPEFTYYADADSDGFGDIDVSIISCQDSPPAGYVTDSSDCNDANYLIHELKLFFADMDGDLFGDSLNAAYFCEIIAPAGYVSNYLDCNDADILINPVTNEICNDIDDNCNLEIDEGLPVQTLFIDADDDGYGDNQIFIITCMLEMEGYVSNNLDCDDTNPAVYPGAEETLNGLDDNCNELIDEGLAIENNLLNEIKIYPNPANDILQIDYSGNETSEIQIVNIAGENIYSDKLTAHLTINIQNLPAGIYLLKIISTENQAVFNFVKE